MYVLNLRPVVRLNVRGGGGCDGGCLIFYGIFPVKP